MRIRKANYVWCPRNSFPGNWNLSNIHKKLFYGTGGLFASAWTKDTWRETTSTLLLGTGLRNAGRTWTLRDGTPAYTLIDYGNLARLEKHMIGSGALRGIKWHIDALWGLIKHLTF